VDEVKPERKQVRFAFLTSFEVWLKSSQGITRSLLYKSFLLELYIYLDSFIGHGGSRSVVKVSILILIGSTSLCQN